MKKIIFSILIGVIVLSFSLNLESASKRKRVAVFDFDFAAVQKWWEGNWDIGKGIADILVTNLVEDGTYSVIERKALEKILAEQDFSTSDRADATTAAKVGKVLGVEYIIIGSITTFGTDTQKVGVGGGGWGLKKFGIGGIGTKKTKAKVVINARMIDVNTGEIVAVAKGTGESKRTGLLLGVGGGGAGGGGGVGIDMSSSDFRETILGEATEAAVTQVKDKLVQVYSKLE
ncbi:MAG: CsgG/HfaB family protein [Acidobacteriota bacterium]